jgi:DNA repair protein RadA/Sms
LCIEVQALVAATGAPIPRRVAQSLENSRLSMLVAVCQRRARLPLGDQDVFASVAGGVRVAEPGADLAIALAIASARCDVPVDPETVVVGELGLGGEVRLVPLTPRRLGEAMRLGFQRAVVPMSTPDVPGMTLQRVADLGEALEAALVADVRV